LYLLLGILSVTLYVGVSALGGQAGFPLDDAWIHQTYARNLAQSGQLAYVPGQPSAGSTAPLWTFLIAIGYRLGIDYRLWTYALGALSLAACGWLVQRLSIRLWPERPRVARAAGALCIFEWHLAWAAASGMETTLFAALALAVFERATYAQARWRDGIMFGALGALLTLTRPEGLLVIGLAGLARLAQTRSANAPRFILSAITGFGVLVLPVAWLNLQASGTLFPNTFYAKQQEYAVYFSSLGAWLPRVLDVLGAPFVGAQVLLVPGLWLEGLAAARSLRDRSTWVRAAPLVWLMAHLAVYATRLPVTYQHGRYMMPIIPIVLLVGLHGSARLAARLPRLLRRVSIGSMVGVAAAFWVVGVGAYRVDVNVIENELVASARWIDTHTPTGALVAAHDIGAIGYFARRPLLDLAGLISPEVIPIIRDEPRLLALMQERQAAYFAAPPDFYTTLLDAPPLERVFSGTSPFAPHHWLVYRIDWSGP
jgi:hypothetical protein